VISAVSAAASIDYTRVRAVKPARSSFVQKPVWNDLSKNERTKGACMKQAGMRIKTKAGISKHRVSIKKGAAIATAHILLLLATDPVPIATH
jgi:hypothetical protein